MTSVASLSAPLSPKSELSQNPLLSSPKFSNVPNEIVEHIGLFVASGQMDGPPTSLLPLMVTCRRINALLDPAKNAHFASKVFEVIFDTSALKRRPGLKETDAGPNVLSKELIRRFRVLGSMRSGQGALATPNSFPSVSTEEVLWTAYLMMLENDGKNALQLRRWGRVEAWLLDYWFTPEGASAAVHDVSADSWPEADDGLSALAMWIIWMLQTPTFLPVQGDDNFDSAAAVLRTFALGAHKYPLCILPWNQYYPTANTELRTAVFEYYGKRCELTVPSISAPAILCYLNMASRNPVMTSSLQEIAPFVNVPILEHETDPNPPASEFDLAEWEAESLDELRRLGKPMPSESWENEWMRCLGRSLFDAPSGLTCFQPGSFQGIWDGSFWFTEFTAYASVMNGANPSVLGNTMFARQRQTWKLREHHLLRPADTTEPTPIALPAGRALQAFFPPSQIKEDKDGLNVPVGGGAVSRYTRYKPGMEISDSIDCILTGEGQSSWGQFNLKARIRPFDGFISFAKEYIEGDRGRWLYRGYIVGNAEGDFVGRWRDTLSPENETGYEGCFGMRRRC